MKTIEELFHVKGAAEKGIAPYTMLERVAYLYARNNGSLTFRGYGKGFTLDEHEAFELTHLSGIFYGFIFAQSKENDKKWQQENIYDPLIRVCKEKGYIAITEDPHSPKIIS